MTISLAVLFFLMYSDDKSRHDVQRFFRELYKFLSSKKGGN